MSPKSKAPQDSQSEQRCGAVLSPPLGGRLEGVSSPLSPTPEWEGKSGKSDLPRVKRPPRWWLMLFLEGASFGGRRSSRAEASRPPPAAPRRE